MAEVEGADEEPPLEQEPATDLPKGRRSLSRMRRELTDEELANSGVQKILMDDTDRLEAECSALREYAAKYHAADKDNAVLRERLKRDTAFDVFIGGALAIGAAMVGYAPNAWAHQPSGYFFLLFGIVLIVTGVIARVVK